MIILFSVCALKPTVKHLNRHFSGHQGLWCLFLLAPGWLAIHLVFCTQNPRKVFEWL